MLSFLISYHFCSWFAAIVLWTGMVDVLETKTRAWETERGNKFTYDGVYFSIHAVYFMYYLQSQFWELPKLVSYNVCRSDLYCSTGDCGCSSRERAGKEEAKGTSCILICVLLLPSSYVVTWVRSEIWVIVGSKEASRSTQSWAGGTLWIKAKLFKISQH